MRERVKVRWSKRGEGKEGRGEDSGECTSTVCSIAMYAQCKNALCK